MNSYDVIVVGTGNSGLTSALSLVNEGYNVLLLDEHNNVGGLSKTLVKGRFEFETSIHNLYIDSSEKYDFKLEEILKKCKVKSKIKYSSPSTLVKVYTKDKNFVLPIGIENYIAKIEELVPGSEKFLRIFFDLAKECIDAMNYINGHKDNLDYEFIKEEYNNFMRISSYSVSKVLDTIGMPLEAQEMINVFWTFLGSSETEISFISYAITLFNLVSGIKVPIFRNYDVSLDLVDKFLLKGGKLKLNSKVVKLIVEDNKINGVKLIDGTTYYANQVIVNSSLNNVYGNLISPEDVPRKALMNINKRELGARVFSVHLGLNRDAQFLGLDNYIYFIYHSLDTDIEYNRMRELNHGNLMVLVHNNVDNNISPEGTCMITLSTLYFSDCFSKNIDSDNYFEYENGIAMDLIDSFQKYTKIKIDDYIEEIEISSPLEKTMIGNYPDGCNYGFKLIGLDDLLPRILNNKNENYIKGLYICGGFDGDVYAYNSSFSNGIEVAKEVKKELEGDK